MPGPDIFLAIQVSMLGVRPNNAIKQIMMLSVITRRNLCTMRKRVYKMQNKGAMITKSTMEYIIDKV